jgi:hypothetical protein
MNEITPEQAFAFFATAGGAIMAFSWLAERNEKWQALTSDKKDWYSFIGITLSFKLNNNTEGCDY